MEKNQTKGIDTTRTAPKKVVKATHKWIDNIKHRVACVAGEGGRAQLQCGYASGDSRDARAERAGAEYWVPDNCFHYR